MLYRNLMLTMLIGGLWHGANWTFVAWGAYHGVLLCLNRVFEKNWQRIAAPVRRGGTFALVIVGWVLFRSTNFIMARALIGKMFWIVPSPAVTTFRTLLALLVVAFLFAHFGKNTFEMTHVWGLAMRCVLILAFSMCVIRIVTSQGTPFLYFQF